jgi:uncharacterized membrane protein
MDVTGVVLSAAVALVAGGLLFWHIQQVRKRPATGHDKLMAALWAALVVLALGRLLYLVANPEPSEPAPAPQAPPPK